MKGILAAFLALCLLYPATFFAQNTYQYRNGEEIPLDDFPQFTPGCRIQIGAFSSESLALAVMDSLNNEIRLKVHLYYADGFWKVRIGDFKDVGIAEHYLKTRLLPLDYHDARVIEDKVKLPLWRKPERAKIDGFRIQVNALSDREQALELGRKLDFGFPDIRAYVIYQDRLYKVQLGDFRTWAKAEAWEQKLSELPDLNAWIVATQIYEDPPPSPLERPMVDPFEFND